jgi:succinate dehydrogenase / fumarate reductase, cytochrome b subunit
MVTSLKEQPLKRQPVYRNIHITQLTSYRLPAAGWVSIMHRISGALMFLLLPFVIWMFDASVTSEISYQQFVTLFAFGGVGIPAVLVKLVVLALIWAYLLHFIAGLRHVWMDMTHAVGKRFGHGSAIFAIALSSILTVALGAKLFF